MAKKKTIETPELVEKWPLPLEATFGSSVRVKGILLEIRARLPSEVRKSLDAEGNILTLGTMKSSSREFRDAAEKVAQGLVGIETLPIIPREIQDILGIKISERHRWLKDGRLPSAGTRTVRLSGRARKITFHVFDPKVVEDILDRGIVDEWRLQDAEAAAENRQRAAYRAKLTRSLKKMSKATKADSSTEISPDLRGWEEFGSDGLLR